MYGMLTTSVGVPHMIAIAFLLRKHSSPMMQTLRAVFYWRVKASFVFVKGSDASPMWTDPEILTFLPNIELF